MPEAKIHVVDASFLISATGPEEGVGWPAPGPVEIGFVGRSNVGKSSLLAALLGRRGLVRISKTPGRTRLINFFSVKLLDHNRTTHELRFVDLPGFGYAKVSRDERAAWQGFMEAYLGGRTTLAAILLLVDARRGLEVDELELARWLAGRGVRVLPVITKIDEVPKHKRKLVGEAAQRALAEALGGKAPQPILTSTTMPAGTGGIDDLLAKLVRVVAGAGGPSAKVAP